ERWRVLHRIGVFLVGEAPDSDCRTWVVIEEDRLDRASGPATAVPAVRYPRLDDSGVGAVQRGHALDGCEIAFQIAASDAEARGEIAELADALIELERRDDFRPHRAGALAEFRHGVGDTHGGYEAHVDGNLC